MAINTEDVETIKELICNDRSVSCNRRFSWLWFLVIAAFAFASGSYIYTYEIDKKTSHLATTQDIQTVLHAIERLEK